MSAVVEKNLFLLPGGREIKRKPQTWRDFQIKSGNKKKSIWVQNTTVRIISALIFQYYQQWTWLKPQNTEYSIFPLKHFKSSRVYLNPAYFSQTTFSCLCPLGLFKALLDMIAQGEEMKTEYRRHILMILYWTCLSSSHTHHTGQTNLR